MSELGQWLREARQAKGLSLEHVEDKTRIRIKFLFALEEGNYDDLPAEIYARGLVRNYALFLGLDPTEAVERYESRDASRRDAAPSLFRPLEVALSRTTIGRLRGRLVLLLLIAAALTAGLWAWRTGRLVWPPPLALFQPRSSAATTPSPSHTPTLIPKPTATATEQPTATVELTATPATSPTLTPGAPPGPTSTRTPAATPEQATAQSTADLTAESPTPATLEPGAGVTLSITITEENWVEVTVDSINVFRGLLNPGEEGSWQAQREIILRLGNAGGAEVTVNGEFLGTLGDRQQVVEFAWGPEGEVTPEPTATATPTPESTVDILTTPSQ
jgi:cytoskeleton protein RodZ